MKLYDFDTTYFKMHPKTHWKWSLEDAMELAKTCSTRSELCDKSSAAYRVLTREGKLDECFPKNK